MLTEIKVTGADVDDVMVAVEKIQEKYPDAIIRVEIEIRLYV